jgi:hypothetical protein
MSTRPLPVRLTETEKSKNQIAELENVLERASESGCAIGHNERVLFA